MVVEEEEEVSLNHSTRVNVHHLFPLDHPGHRGREGDFKPSLSHYVDEHFSP